MARTTTVFSISLPPQMMEELESAMLKEHRTRSELVREALRFYLARSVLGRDAGGYNDLLSSSPTLCKDVDDTLPIFGH